MWYACVHCRRQHCDGLPARIQLATELQVEHRTKPHHSCRYIFLGAPSCSRDALNQREQATTMSTTLKLPLASACWGRWIPTVAIRSWAGTQTNSPVRAFGLAGRVLVSSSERLCSRSGCSEGHPGNADCDSPGRFGPRRPEL